MPLPDDMIQLLEGISTDGEDRPDLAGEVENLLALAVRAVPRCVAVSLTVDRDGLPVTVTALTMSAGIDPVLGSLSIHLPRAKSSGTAREGPRLVLYASAAGAFDRLRIDLLALLDLDPTRTALDTELVLPALADPIATATAAVGQLDDITSVERALGVLLDRGYLIEDGRAELVRRAASGETTVPAVARLLLESVADDHNIL